MSITFREFVEILEGKKKKEKIKELKNAYLAGREQATPQIKNYGGITAPNSEARRLKVAAMMRDSGGGAVRRAQQEKEKAAKKAAKNILKQQQEGFSIKKSQEELEKKRKEAEKQKQQERQQRSSELYHERTRGPGMVSYEKDESGVVRRGRRKDGKFTPDADT
jgi:hypothetical protein